MRGWPHITRHIGALPAARVTWGLALAFCLWAVLDLFVLKLSSGLGNSTYDSMVRARFYSAPPDARLVIVDIDEASLVRMAPEFGRWPWSRDTLATVLDYIEKQTPQAIAWDILFSDADRLSPGGDKAFDEAARRSTHSHFSVVRLPAEYDAHSAITRDVLPSLWVAAPPTPGTGSTVALIAPVLPAVAASRLGYSNGYPDSDGVLRRYRLAEALPDGSQIQSLALRVATSLEPQGLAQAPTERARELDTSDALMVWRARAHQYPRVAFADVFAAAEGVKPLHAVPSFAGKIVLIGATASGLHDIHPTPLAAQHAGIDSLATALDNAVNQRAMTELPRWLQVALAMGLCLGVAWWSQRHGIGSLDAALLLLPCALLGVSYLSLNGELLLRRPVFINLHLSAGMALVFLALLRTWNGWRRDHWCGDVPALLQDPGVMALTLSIPVAGAGLDALIHALERYAPQCRVLGGDIGASWPSRLHWPELQTTVALAGPLAQLESVRAALLARSASTSHRATQVKHLGVRSCAPPRAVSGTVERSQWAHQARLACADHLLTN